MPDRHRIFGTSRFVTQTFGTQQHQLQLPGDITPAERQQFAAALYAGIVNQCAEPARGIPDALHEHLVAWRTTAEAYVRSLMPGGAYEGAHDELEIRADVGRLLVLVQDLIAGLPRCDVTSGLHEDGA